MSFLSEILSHVLPARCPVTGDVVPTQGSVSPAGWQRLNFISDPQCACCGLPLEVAMEGTGDLLCGPCTAEPRPYRLARSALVYDDESRKLILAFKHGDQTHLTLTFAPMLKSAGGAFLAECDLLVPVPLHWKRLIRRRYNQAGLLVQELGKQAGIEFDPTILRRVRHTPTQGHLSQKKRLENVHKAFAIEETKRKKVEGKNVVLIDDVFTTGATIEECAKTLQAAGAARVDVLTVARVARPDSIS